MLYNCDDCPAYCCAYPIISLTKRDIRRLARHFELSEEEAKEEFTEQENNRVRKLKQRPDKQMKTPVCVFLNQKTRGCSIYEARPQICRDYPGDRCEWFDRRLFELAAATGKKYIRLKVMPWKVDADYPTYTANKQPRLLEAYAQGNGEFKKRKKYKRHK